MCQGRLGVSGEMKRRGGDSNSKKKRGRSSVAMGIFRKADATLEEQIVPSGGQKEGIRKKFRISSLLCCGDQKVSLEPESERVRKGPAQFRKSQGRVHKEGSVLEDGWGKRKKKRGRFTRNPLRSGGRSMERRQVY